MGFSMVRMTEIEAY